MKLEEKFLWVLIFLAFITGILTAGQRIAIERANSHVEVVMDFSALSELSRTDGTPEEEIAGKFKNAGVTGLAFNEDTLDSLRIRGALNWYTGLALVRAMEGGAEKAPAGLTVKTLPPVVPSRVYITVYESSTLRQLLRYLPLFLGKERVTLWAGKNDALLSPASPAVIEVVAEEKLLPYMGAGFSKERIDTYFSRGFQIIVRPENKKLASTAMIQSYTEVLAELPPLCAMVFTGPDNDVLGYPDYLADTASMLKSLNCNLGLIEAPNMKAMQKGIQSLSLDCAPQSIRVLSFPPLMQDKLSIDDLISKFELGVRERNIRMLYLRPYARPVKDKGLLETNVFYLSKLKDTLTAAGFAPGGARSFADFGPSVPSIIILSSGALAAFILLLIRITGVPLSRMAFLVVLWALVIAACAATKHILWAQKLSALGCGLIFPALAFVLFMPSMRESLKEKNFLSLASSSSWALLKISSLTLAGGIIMAALLSSTEFLLQIDRFKGIKLLMIAPPLFAAIYYVLITSQDGKRPLNLLNFPLQAWHLAMLFLVGGAGAYYILRTGNTTEAATSAFELSIRSFLNKIMVVRPRFKDFLMGHPALMMACGFFKLRLDRGLWLLMLMAGIGQADIVDTLAHLHTPLLVSLLRIAYGLVLGWAVGLCLLLILWKYGRRQEEAAAVAKE